MLAWMDLEMTGLDPSRHVIVEIATLITDDELNLVAEGPDLVVQASEAELAEMDDFVRNMHTRSGLLEQIKTSTVTLEAAGEATLAFLKEHIPEPGTVPLCGNSIGTDRRFLATALPDIEDYLHYGRSMSRRSRNSLDAGTQPTWRQCTARTPATGPSTTFARASTSSSTGARQCSAPKTLPTRPRRTAQARRTHDQRSCT